MAEIRSIDTDKRRQNGGRRTGYVEGTAVRRLQTEQQPQKRQERRQEPQIRRSRQEKSERLGLGYMLFLTAACALALWVCAGYLELQADNTASVKHIASLESQLSDLKQDNDDEYNRVITSVDLEEIRDIAINELGMVYAGEDQVVLYDSEGSDYVRQYAEVPGEESGWKELLGTVGR